MSLTVEPLNLPEVERQMQAWGRSLRLKVLQRVIAEELEPMAEDVRRRAEPHRRHGRLAGGVEVIDKGPGAAAINLADQRYGQFLEFGSSHQPAAPLLRPAFDEGKGALVAGVQRRLRALLAAAR